MKPLGQITDDPADHGEAVSRLSKLAEESDRAQSDHVTVADENLNVWYYGTTDPQSTYLEDGPIVVNEIQNAILATTPKEPPRIELEPVETDDPGITVPQLDPSGMPQVDPVTGMPAVTVINDKLVKKVYQKVFDVFWARSRVDEWIRRERIWKRVFGWTFGVYGWDDDAKVARLRMLSPKQSYPDPVQEFIKDAAYFGCDEYLDASYAKRLWPELAEAIDEHAMEGQPQAAEGSTSRPERFNQQFNRGMVTLRTFWMRYEDRPITMQEAIEVAQNPDAPISLMNMPTGNMVPVSDEMGNPMVGMDGQPVTEPEYREAIVDGEGNELTEGDESWPRTPIIREIQVIAGRVVTDRECEHWDIPVLHDVHIPVFGGPWGQGDPFRLRPLQRAQSRMIDSMVNYTEFFKAPLRAIPESTYNHLKDTYGDAYVAPDRIMVIPDSVIQATGGKIDMVTPPPPLPESLVTVQQVLKNTLAEQSGYTKELRGIASNPDQSGRQTALLSANASSLSEFMGRSEEEMVWRLARLMLHSLITRLTMQDVQKICSSYPPDVLALIMTKARDAEWDIRVTVTTGSGAADGQKRIKRQEDLASGAISMQTYREGEGIDHDTEQKRITTQTAEQAALGATLAPQNDGEQEQK